MSIWIIIALLTAVWGLASLPRDIRDDNPDEPFCVWVDPWDNHYTNDDLAEIVRRCNAAHSPDTTMFISHARDIANK